MGLSGSIKLFAGYAGYCITLASDSKESMGAISWIIKIKLNALIMSHVMNMTADAKLLLLRINYE